MAKKFIWGFWIFVIGFYIYTTVSMHKAELKTIAPIIPVAAPPKHEARVIVENYRIELTPNKYFWIRYDVKNIGNAPAAAIHIVIVPWKGGAASDDDPSDPKAKYALSIKIDDYVNLLEPNKSTSRELRVNELNTYPPTIDPNAAKVCIKSIDFITYSEKTTH
jgi:hypothetical protein